MPEPAPKIKAPTTDVPFLDPEPVSEVQSPSEGNGTGNHPVGAESAGSAAFDSPTSAQPSEGPCADCAKYAQIGYVAGAIVGIAAGGIVAYVILRNRLAPNG